MKAESRRLEVKNGFADGEVVVQLPIFDLQKDSVYYLNERFG